MKKILTIFCCVLFSSLSYGMNKKLERHNYGSEKETIKILEIILRDKNTTVTKIKKELFKNTKSSPSISNLLEHILAYKLSS